MVRPNHDVPSKFPQFLVATALAAMMGPLSGCASPYHADQGALFGGLLGAGTGAIVGEAVGNPLAGAAIGAGVGTLSGAAIGSGMDEVEARNRAEIQAQLGQPVSTSAVTLADLMSMSQAGVDDQLIITHIQKHGAAQPLTAAELIQLKQSGVSSAVIQQYQSSPPNVVRATPVRYVSQAPVVVEEVYVGPSCYPCYPRRHHHWGPHVGWGFSYTHCD